jgi:hypothetical protein
VSRLCHPNSLPSVRARDMWSGWNLWRPVLEAYDHTCLLFSYQDVSLRRLDPLRTLPQGGPGLWLPRAERSQCSGQVQTVSCGVKESERQRMSVEWCERYKGSSRLEQARAVCRALWRRDASEL